MFVCRRRYRDKERSEPATPAPITTTPRATTPSESKKSTINVTVNPKSLSTNASTAKSSAKITKKIDMGAASNFGRDLGINSPTHRNTHAEEDLFGDVTVPVATTKTDLLDDIFKTCPTTNNSVSGTVSSQSNTIDDDLFNPRADDPQEFGDFTQAFDNLSPPTQASQPDQLVDNNVNSNSNSSSISIVKEDEFADFRGFESNQTSSNTNDPANLLFAVNTTPNAQTTTASISNQKVGDLLSDLDGLSLDVSVPTGKSATHFPHSHTTYSFASLILFRIMRGYSLSLSLFLYYHIIFFPSVNFFLLNFSF